MEIFLLIVLGALVFVTVAFVREARLRRALESLVGNLLGKRGEHEKKNRVFNNRTGHSSQRMQ